MLFLSSRFRKQQLSLTISGASFLGSLRRSFCCFLQRFVSGTANLNGVLSCSARGWCLGLRSFVIRCRGLNWLRAGHMDIRLNRCAGYSVGQFGSLLIDSLPLSARMQKALARFQQICPRQLLSETIIFFK
jgi:hypothetical protein